MVNCNPETVSTDYDTSDRLYFEPLTLEDVLNIVEKEKPLGVIVQFGGQTPLKLAVPLREAGVPILGHVARRHRPRRGPRSASTRSSPSSVCARPPAPPPARWPRPRPSPARSATRCWCGPPTCWAAGPCRSSTTTRTSCSYMTEAVKVAPEHPILIDKFLEDAIEIDVDAVCDGEHVVVGGVMEHIEKAGVHSGDAACALPPYSLDEDQVQIAPRPDQGAGPGARRGRADQRAVRDPQRRRCTCSRSTRAPRARCRSSPRPSACRWPRSPPGPCWARAWRRWPRSRSASCRHIAVKERSSPSSSSPGWTRCSGPEMKSTGEVMGIDSRLPQGLSQVADRGGLHPAHVGQGVRLRQERATSGSRRRWPGGWSSWASRWWPPPGRPACSSGRA